MLMTESSAGYAGIKKEAKFEFGIRHLPYYGATEAPQNTILVLDATTGQNAISQVETFREIAEVSGLIMTKLDGTAKGGIMFAIAQSLELPIRFIGVGEQKEDLLSFEAKPFVDAIFE